MREGEASAPRPAQKAVGRKAKERKEKEREEKKPAHPAQPKGPSDARQEEGERRVGKGE